MRKPRRFLTLYHIGDKLKEFWTDDESLAEKRAILRNGTVWIDTRYKAKLRLYWYLRRKELYAKVKQPCGN